MAAILLAMMLLSAVAFPSTVFAEGEAEAETTTEETSQPEEEPTDDEPQENDGEDGSGGDEPTENGETVIETGDAGAGSNVGNQVNTNIVDTENPVDLEDETPSTTPTEAPDDNATGTPENASSTTEILVSDEDEETEGLGEEENGTTTEPLADLTVQNENAATTTNTASTSAGTGDNSAGGDLVTIDTGDAVATANVVNVVNTNIINSSGFLLFLSQLFGVTSLDLQNIFNIFDDTFDNSRCSLFGCDSSDTSMYITNNNTATVTNDVVVRANTGGNSASGNDSLITTGDAYASANVLNVVNTNIIDANYLVLSFTNFGDFIGDIILPNANFFSRLFNGSGGVSGDVTVENDNTAIVDNNVSVDADTGDNTASSTGGSALVDTGTAVAQANVFNQINTNIFNDDSFMMVFRIHGDWNGDILGLPDNISWGYTPGGFTLFNSSLSTPQSTISDMTVMNTNTAYIQNNVDVAAMTGGNSVSGSEVGVINTGNAYASANVVNVVNTNILGRNWALLIFDIFGDWTGNVSFGQPDLWIGVSAHSDSNPIGVGSTVDYTFTVSNLGDVDATNVQLETLIDEQLLEFPGDVHSWNLGTIEGGETVEVTYSATVSSNIAFGASPIELFAEVTSTEEDSNPDNNSDYVTVMVSRKTSGTSGGGGRISFKSNLEVSKTIADSTIEPGETASYTIVIENTGGPTYHSALVDTIYDSNNEIVTEHSWDLGTIHNDEVITITYDVEFVEGIMGGLYENSAQIYAYDRSPSLQHADKIESNIASVGLMIGSDVLVPEVLGASDLSCEQYLTSFLRRGVVNNPSQVTRLQTFLNDFEGAHLPVTGFFDTRTEAAVRVFQSTYASDVLEPWGMSVNSGYVYLTTRKKINELYCKETLMFPLSVMQLNEIQTYRGGFDSLHQNTTPPLPLFGEHDSTDTEPVTVFETKENAIIEAMNDRGRVNSKTQTSTPDSVVRLDAGEVVKQHILKAINWFRDLAQI